MPVINYKPSSKPIVEPNLPRIEPENYQSIVVDTNDIPISSLLAYIEGGPWTVTYYSQVLSKHNDIREVDSSQPGIYQQYTKINNMELRVTSPLSTSYDQDNAITGVTGGANVYPFLVPNISDYFTSDTLDNKLGIFKVTSVERKAFNKLSVFFIEYEMVGYANALPEIINDLNAKSIRTYYFDKSRLVEGSQPLLKAEDYEQVSSLSTMFDNIVRYYYKTFFNRAYMNLVVPGQDNAVYDSFLVSYITRIVNSLDAPEIGSVRKINTDNDQYLAQSQFWNLLYNRDYNGIQYCNKQMGLAVRQCFNWSSFLHGFYFSNMDYMVYPVDVDTTVNVGKNMRPIPVSSTEFIIDQEIQDPPLPLDTYTNKYSTFTTIAPVSFTDSYVLSSEFYNNTENQTVLEILTKDYMQYKILDLGMLHYLAKKYRSWTKLQQFYYGPILLTLLNEANTTAYTS